MQDTLPNFDFTPGNLPRALLDAIGLMITSASQAENIMNSAIAGLLGVDFMLGGAVTTHVSTQLKFSMLASLAELRISDKDDLAEFDRLLEALNETFTLRNAVAHNQWAIRQDDRRTITLKETARSHYDLEAIAKEPSEVAAEARVLYDASMDLYSYLLRHDLIARIPEQPHKKAHPSAQARRAHKRRSS